MSWTQIRGHEHLVGSFNRAVARDRLAHAYLFVGPPGVGKSLFAHELAKAILCETPPPGMVLAACDRCDSCLLVRAGTHPDFFVVRRPEEGNEFPIGLMRELCQNFTMTTARGHGKVAILEDADDLNDAAANCFLKTLEEPPPRSVFILIGTSIEQQMATIRSRCQVVRFAPLAEPVVREVLKAQGIAEGDRLDRLVRLSGGSPGQALALADDALWECRRTLLTGLASAKPNSVSLARGLVEFAEDAGKDTSLQRRRLMLVFRLLIEAMREVLAIRAGAPVRPGAADEQALLAALAGRANFETICAWIDRCLAAEDQLGRYVPLGLVAEALMDSLVHGSTVFV